MRGGCTAMISPSVHANSRFGAFIDGSFHHQGIRKLEYLDQQMMLCPGAPGKAAQNIFVKREPVAPQVFEDTEDGQIDSYLGKEDLGWALPPVTRNAGCLEAEYRKERTSSKSELVIREAQPILPSHLLCASLRTASPRLSHSPDNKRNALEPRSVLDLATSPRPSACSVSHSYDFTPSSFESNAALLRVQGEFLSAIQGIRKDYSTPHLSLVQDSSRLGPHRSSSDGLHQTNRLWMDALIDDLKDVPIQPSFLELRNEKGEIQTDSPSSIREPKMRPSTNQKQSDEEGPIGDMMTGEDSPTLQQVQSDSFGDNPKGDPNHDGVNLVNLLLTCAEAVSTKNMGLVNPLFAQLGELASPEGTSIQRVAAYFTEGLASRCSRLWPHIYQPLPCNLDLSEEDNISAFHILNHVCPYTKFAHFTANEIILQAFEGCKRVHVIDFDIKQGLQWPAFFQTLATRPEGPPEHVRITGIGDCKDDVNDTGDRLAEFADALDLPFEFHAVIDKLEDVRLWMLHVNENEVVAVNCIFQLHRTLNDSGDGIKNLLGLIKSTRAKVVAVLEQEASHNGPFFDGRSPRILESLQYYAAIFDSLDLNMSVESALRMKVEKLFAREIRNILACEGPERTERHERTETWRLHLESGGFQSVMLSKRAVTQARLLLEMFACKSYTLTEHDGVLTLGWGSRPLFSGSAWSPKHVLDK